MNKYIFSVPYSEGLLTSVVVATNYISAHARLIADDPIWKGGNVRILQNYPTKEKASIAFKAHSNEKG